MGRTMSVPGLQKVAYSSHCEFLVSCGFILAASGGRRKTRTRSVTLTLGVISRHGRRHRPETWNEHLQGESNALLTHQLDRPPFNPLLLALFFERFLLLTKACRNTASGTCLRLIKFCQSRRDKTHDASTLGSYRSLVLVDHLQPSVELQSAYSFPIVAIPVNCSLM